MNIKAGLSKRTNAVSVISILWGMTFTYAIAAQPPLGNETNPGANSPWEQKDNSVAKPLDAYFSNYQFRSGETLEKLKIHYATLGTPHKNAEGEIDNAVLVLHWTGADSRSLLSPSYVSALFSAGKPLDPRKYFLIFADSVGHGQSSQPSDGLKAAFPTYGYNDIVDIQHKLVTEVLGVKRLHAILGMSMGGMNAWQWAEAYPDAVEGIMPVVSMPIKVSGRNMLWRRMVINDIRSDPEWNEGNYTKPPTGWVRGYEILSMMINGVPHLQTSIPNSAAADSFISEARSKAQKIDANNILYSIQSSADYDPEPGLYKIKAKVFALNFDDDAFNPVELKSLQRLMPKVAQGRYVMQPGTPESYGHLTMAYPEQWANQVRTFMDWLEGNMN